MAVNKTYGGDHFAVVYNKSQIITLYFWNKYNVWCQLYLNKGNFQLLLSTNVKTVHVCMYIYMYI